MNYYDSIIEKPLDLNHPAYILREVIGLSGKAYDYEVLKYLAFLMGDLIIKFDLIFDDIYDQFIKAAVRAGWTEDLISRDIYRSMHRDFKE